jgi:LysR family glycine cleavage system transcriptional activator
MRKLPPLGELRAFEAAARHMSFKLAAEELAVTPTAISHQIRLLEAFCGRQLFRRRPRPMTLTDAGAALFPSVHAGMDAFSESLHAISNEELKSLKITATGAFASSWF